MNVLFDQLHDAIKQNVLTCQRNTDVLDNFGKNNLGKKIFLPCIGPSTSCGLSEKYFSYRDKPKRYLSGLT